MTSDDVFFGLLGWLARNQAVLSESAEAGHVDQDVYVAAIRHPYLDERLLVDMVGQGHSGEIDGRRPRSSIYMEPVTKGDSAVPMLSPHWDLREPERRAVHLYLGLYFRDEKWGVVDGTGFRYEAPHGSGDTIGRHDYFHAQPIMDFADGVAVELPVQGRTGPEATPAFPLEADNLAELLVCLLLSLYGGSYVKTLAQSGVDGIGPVLEGLTCCRPRSD